MCCIFFVVVVATFLSIKNKSRKKENMKSIHWTKWELQYTLYSVISFSYTSGAIIFIISFFSQIKIWSPSLFFTSPIQWNTFATFISLRVTYHSIFFVAKSVCLWNRIFCTFWHKYKVVHTHTFWTL